MSAFKDVQAVVIDAENPQRVFAASTQGVMRSDDAAQSWVEAGAGLPEAPIVALAQHPVDLNRLYAATRDGRLFRTDDAGTTWHPTK